MQEGTRYPVVIIFGGAAAWFLWLFFHLLLLINFESRLVVLVPWAFSYFAYSRGSRVLLARRTLRLTITGAESANTLPEKGWADQIPSSNRGEETWNP